MLVVVCVAAAAAAAVVAYAQVQRRSPEASTASLRAVRELAAVVLVLVKAVEAVVDVLGHQRVQTTSAPSRSGLLTWSHNLCGSGPGFDLVAQDEVGAGVAGVGRGEVFTQLGDGGGGAPGW